jgi:hypothetical protein
MPAPPRLLMDYLRDHLITAGLVRDPDVAGDAPPFWLSPDGIPAPGAGKAPKVGPNVVLAAMVAPETPSRRHEGFLASEHVDLWIRSRTVPQAIEIHHALREELHDKYHWDMAGLIVQESMMNLGFAYTGGPAQALTHRAQYRFEYFTIDAEG